MNSAYQTTSGNNRRCAALLAGAGLLLLAGLPGLVQAQEAGAQEPPLDAIIVTAQRRAENLQDVPIAATAITGDALEDRGVSRLSDLEIAAPALSITDAGETLSLNIRGIGLSSNLPSVTNGVALYMDGLFQAQIVNGVPFYDIANVEVLRGPQGTLVGNNSTGGAVFINSVDPSLAGVSGYAYVGVGNYESREGEGAVNLPLTDTLAIRAAGLIRARDTFYTDVGPFDNRAGKLDERSGRVGLLWQPGAFRALLKAQLTDRESGGFAYRPADGTAFAAGRVGDEFTLSYDVPTAQEERAFQTSLELEYELAGGLLIRSLSGYQFKRNAYYQDADASQIPISPTGGVVIDYFARDRQLSQEINIISPTGGRFDWILGAYYQDADILVDFMQVSPRPQVDYVPRQDRDTYGLFGQGNYALTEQLELQLGLRWSRVTTSGTGSVLIGNGDPGFPPGGVPVADLSGSNESSRMTGKLALNWQPDDDNLFYAFVARGFKPGGFNSQVSEFLPENVWDYELGWKGTLADGRLRAQVGAFYNDYSNVQFDILDPASGVTGVTNIGSATVKGLEAQLQARFGALGFHGGVAYTDSRIDGLTFVNARLLPPGQLGPQCPVGVPSSPPACFDYGYATITTAGGPNLYSPEWTYNFGVEYEIDLGGASLIPRVHYGYVGPRFNYLAYAATDRLAGRGLLSAQAMLAIGDWEVELWANNLTNKVYVSGRSGDNEFVGAPREYGLRLGFTF